MAYSQSVCAGSLVYGQMPSWIPDPGIPQSAAGISDVVGSCGIVYCSCAPGLYFESVVKKNFGVGFSFYENGDYKIKYGTAPMGGKVFLPAGAVPFFMMYKQF